MNATKPIKKRSDLVREALTCAWRNPPPPLEISAEELYEVLPLLLGSGAAGLGWWRASLSNLRTSRAAPELQGAYRFHTIRATYYEHEIKQVFRLLRSEAIEPVLVKGWSIGRLYPAKGLRPYGDIDLCVSPKQFAKAKALLDSPAGKDYPTDLHAGFREAARGAGDGLFARTQLVRLGDVDVRVLGPEDLLRVVCIHLLRHGAWRPLWLCDVALLVESRRPSFNWDLCLSRDRRQADWVACAVRLSHELLQANVRDTPFNGRAKKLPGWVIKNVLEQWEAPFLPLHSPMKHQTPMAGHLRHPQGMLKYILRRWPGPIEATIHMNGRFNGVPRLPFQLAHSFSRAVKFLSGPSRPASRHL